MNRFKIIADKIKLERKKNKLSQEQLAEKAQLHRAYIGQIERVEKKIGIDNLEKIAKALGKDLIYFLE